MAERSLIKDTVRLFSNPVLTLWVSYNQAWDRIDSLDRTEAFVDRLCTFINPEGMKALMEKQDTEMEIAQPYRDQPGPKVKLPKVVLDKYKDTKFSSIGLPKGEQLDEIVPGGDDAS